MYLIILKNKIYNFDVKQKFKKQNSRLKFVIFYNKFCIIIEDEIIVFLYNNLIKNTIKFLYNNLLSYNLILIEIKNILIKNKYLKFNFISFKLWFLLKKNLLSYDYMTFYWLLNKILNKTLMKKYYWNHLLLKILIILNKFI